MRAIFSIQVRLGIQSWVHGMGKRGEKKPQAQMELSSRIQDLVNEATRAHGKTKSPAPAHRANTIATPSRSKTLPPTPAAACEEATTPAKPAAPAAGETPVPMSVQSTGTPLKSPDYKRLRMEATPSSPSVATKLSFEDKDESSSDGCALRHTDTMSTLGYQFASTLNLNDGV